MGIPYLASNVGCRGPHAPLCCYTITVRAEHTPYAIPNLDSPYAITYTHPMKHTSSTQLRANLSKLMDQVNDDHEPLIVTRANGKSVIMLSLEDYDEIDATMHLLASPRNASRLMAAIERDKMGVFSERALIEE